ncbi:MAG TPA: fimbrial protein [Buttiauxella sp.]
MKFNKTILAMAMGFSMVAGAANAAGTTTDQGHGKVTFTGSIIDAPCSIAAKDVDQIVPLGEIANKSLESGGKSEPHPFDIELVNCDLGTVQTVTTTFTGAADTNAPAMLGIAGSASGAGIVLTDGSSKPITLGQPTDGQILQNGTNTLLFSAYLQGDGASEIVPGAFTSVTNFTLAYN